MAIIPLSDASRRPARFPLVTALIIVVNVLVFLLELARGDAFVTGWAVIPAEIVAGHRWITILTARVHAGRVRSRRAPDRGVVSHAAHEPRRRGA